MLHHRVCLCGHLSPLPFPITCGKASNITARSAPPSLRSTGTPQASTAARARGAPPALASQLTGPLRAVSGPPRCARPWACTMPSTRSTRRWARRSAPPPRLVAPGRWHLTNRLCRAHSRNAAIEKWVKHKEDFHLRFKYTPKMFANSVLWGLLVPIGVYYLVRSEQAPPPALFPARLQPPVVAVARAPAVPPRLCARRSETTGKTSTTAVTPAKRRATPRRSATSVEERAGRAHAGGSWRWGRRLRRREGCSGAPTTRTVRVGGGMGPGVVVWGLLPCMVGAVACA